MSAGGAVGILGGTFDPVHFGHLRAAVEVMEALGLAEMRLLPSAQPPHRDTPEVSAEERMRLLELACAEVPGLSVDRRELDRQGPSFMVDTLASLRADLGARPLILALGVDAFLGLPEWSRWRELFDLTHILVMSRPGFEVVLQGPLAQALESRQTQRAADLVQSPNGRVLLQTITSLEISATDIRARLARGASIRFLTPEPVCRRITELGLYS